MEQSSLLTSLLVGFVTAGGIGTILGVLVNRQQNKMTATAAATGHAIDGLSRLAQEQRAELDDKNEEIERLKAELRKARRTR